MVRNILIGLGILIVLVLAFMAVSFYTTKGPSPEKKVDFRDRDLTIRIFYNSPSKRGRKIFGELVPHHKVWRMGANEPTTFETNKKLYFGEKALPPGKYSVWAIPAPQVWEVIFNSQIPLWGVDFSGEAARESQFDKLNLTVPVVKQQTTTEVFTIEIKNKANGKELLLIWDRVMIALPFHN